jgi:ribonuclease D
VYLVQLSTGQETYLVDPLAVGDLRPLGRFLEDADTVVVFHDADYDLRVLDRDYGLRVRNMFDTRIAAQLAGEPAVGLGSLLERHFRVELDKRLQRADWSLRPLTPDMLRYAADDTRHLLKLRHLLADRLTDLGRLEWALEEFHRLEEVRWSAPKRDDDGAHLRLKGAKALTARQLAILQHLHDWRDRTARALDRAPFRVVSNAVLVALARAAPATLAAMSAVHGLPRSVLQRYGADMHAVVAAALRIPDAELPRQKRTRRPPPDAQYDARLERLKTLRNRRAADIALDPGLVCPNGTLQAIARSMAETPEALAAVSELRRWQRGVLGVEAVLRAVAGADAEGDGR